MLPNGPVTNRSHFFSEWDLECSTWPVLTPPSLRCFPGIICRLLRFTNTCLRSASTSWLTAVSCSAHVINLATITNYHQTSQDWEPRRKSVRFCFQTTKRSVVRPPRGGNAPTTYTTVSSLHAKISFRLAARFSFRYRKQSQRPAVRYRKRKAGHEEP